MASVRLAPIFYYSNQSLYFINEIIEQYFKTGRGWGEGNGCVLKFSNGIKWGVGGQGGACLD